MHACLYKFSNKLSLLSRDDLNNREWQTDCTPLDKYHFPWTKKAFDVTLNY